MPGTLARQMSSILVIDMPASVRPRWTRASVRTSVGVKPAPASAFESAIEKQPA